MKILNDANVLLIPAAKMPEAGLRLEDSSLQTLMVPEVSNRH